MNAICLQLKVLAMRSRKGITNVDVIGPKI